MAKLFDFLARNYTASALDDAKKRVGRDKAMQRVLEILDSNPQATPDDIAAVLGYRTDGQGTVVAGADVSPTIVATRHIPYAQRLLQEAHDAVTSAQQVQQTSQQQPQTGPLVVNIPAGGLTATPLNAPLTIEDLERETVSMVMNSGTETTWDKKLRRWTISAFKTVGPFGVLGLTIPETVWTFTHIYTAIDPTLTVMTWIFSFVLDFGFLAITNLLAENKDNINKKQIRNQPVEDHDKKVVGLQTAAWWIVAILDSAAQITFLAVATWGSHVFPMWLTLGLSIGRVIDLGVVMWVVSFAGVELTTNIDRVVNERLEMANGVRKLTEATNTVRMVQQEARLKLEENELEMARRREESDFLTDLRRESYVEVRELKEEARMKRLNSPNASSQKKLP